MIVRHEQLREEENYPCIHGVAYPRIYTDDAVILFQDEKQRRYAATVDYNVKKLFNEREMIDKVLAFDIEEKGLVLHCSENAEPDALNLKVFQRIPDTEGFSDEYQRNIREKLLVYYAEHICEEDMDSYLKQMDYRKFAEELPFYDDYENYVWYSSHKFYKTQKFWRTILGYFFVHIAIY